jgi:hypothetical protein
MQIDCFKEDSLTFKITNTDGDNAVDMFNTILKKCKREAGKRGFNNMFNSDEKAFIKEFTEKIMNDEVKY